VALVKAVKDTYPQTFYIQNALSVAIGMMRAAFKCADETDSAHNNPQAGDQPGGNPHDPLIYSSP
jgi:hypothetical protein